MRKRAGQIISNKFSTIGYYFKKKPQRLLYALSFFLLYLSVVLYAATPLNKTSNFSIYCPEKHEISVAGSAAPKLKAYYGDNFLFPKSSDDPWMKNHGMIILQNMAPYDIKVNLSFFARPYKVARVIKVVEEGQILIKNKIGVRGKYLQFDNVWLPRGETVLSVSTTDSRSEAGNELGLAEKSRISIRISQFKVDKVDEINLTKAESWRIRQQKLSNSIDGINYISILLVGIACLGIALLASLR